MMAGGAAAAGVAHAEREEWSDAARCFSEALLEDAGNAEVHEARLSTCLNRRYAHMSRNRESATSDTSGLLLSTLPLR